jgi:hypothetical protein
MSRARLSNVRGRLGSDGGGERDAAAYVFEKVWRGSIRPDTALYEHKRP